MQTHWSLVVIGAGPAGMAAALEAARHGVQALVLEPDVARALRTKAYESGWAGIDKSSPKYAAQLRELFGGYQP